ncbi:hypothetical protein ONZ45_g19585 [Pleurotus djamor]|nr:hypothetical protein ONZ45_g19585 [Pleurotus djamor]
MISSSSSGALYFAVMVLANLLNILTFYLPSPLLRGSLATFASLTSVTMISRLLLNLHVNFASIGDRPSLPSDDALFTTVYVVDELGGDEDD